MRERGWNFRDPSPDSLRRGKLLEQRDGPSELQSGQCTSPMRQPALMPFQTLRYMHTQEHEQTRSLLAGSAPAVVRGEAQLFPMRALERLVRGTCARGESPR